MSLIFVEVKSTNWIGDGSKIYLFSLIRGSLLEHQKIASDTHNLHFTWGTIFVAPRIEVSVVDQLSFKHASISLLFF